MVVCICSDKYTSSLKKIKKIFWKLIQNSYIGNKNLKKYILQEMDSFARPDKVNW